MFESFHNQDNSFRTMQDAINIMYCSLQLWAAQCKKSRNGGKMQYRGGMELKFQKGLQLIQN